MGAIMTAKPTSLKLYYNNLGYKLKPSPLTYSELLNRLPSLIPSYPDDPIFTYKDSSGDTIKIANTTSLNSFYSDLEENKSLSIEISKSFEEILRNSKKSLQSSEEDIINLALLGTVFVDKHLLDSIKFTQTDFSKKLIQELLNLVRESSIELVAERFQVSWEVIFFMTQKPNMEKKTQYKSVSYTKVKNIIRPTEIYNAFQNYLKKKVKKKDLIKKFEISPSIFNLWTDVFRQNVREQTDNSHLQKKEKLKLVSCYLTGKITLDDLKYDYNITQEQVNYWANKFSKEDKVYERDRIISAEEKYDILNRFHKGSYTADQFQNDYGIGGNLLYRWARQVQNGKPLTSSNIFRTSSDELEQAYNKFLELYKATS